MVIPRNGSDQWGTPNSSVTLWIEHEAIVRVSTPWIVHFVVGLYVSFVGIFGFLANGTILLFFIRYKRLRTPANIFVMNLALSDFCSDCFHPMAAFSSFQGEWSFGRSDALAHFQSTCTTYFFALSVCRSFGSSCQVYALAVGFFGINSIITLSAIACERCIVIASRPFGTDRKITRNRAFQICVAIWIECAILVIPPLLGWSSYVPEGFFTSCSWDYTTRSAGNRSYYIFLLIFGFLVPFILIVVCYSVIYCRVISHNREMFFLTTTSQKSSFYHVRRQTDIKIAKIIIMLILVFLAAWTPYAIVSFIGQFGSLEHLSPEITAIPAYIAKGATIVDPIIYGFSHPQLRYLLRKVIFNRWSKQTRRLSGSIAATSTVWNNSRMASRKNYRVTTSSCSTNINRYRNCSLTVNRHQRRRLRTFREEETSECQIAIPCRSSCNKEYYSDGIVDSSRRCDGSVIYSSKYESFPSLQIRKDWRNGNKSSTAEIQLRQNRFRYETGLERVAAHPESLLTNL